MPKTYTKTKLPNGLTVLLKEIHTTPLISLWVWYRVGSKDEVPPLTGISHLVEHMQFKGTRAFPAELMDKAVAREGGTRNAFTFLDWTTYFETMPADKIEIALRLEADRMTRSLFDPKDVASERTVVISEREGHENEPMFLLSEAVQQAAFRVHPYHHETIGDMADLQMLGRIRRHFGRIPAGSPPPRLQRDEPEPRGETRVTVEGPGETGYLQVAYRFPSADHHDYFALAVLDSLLAGPTNLNMFGGGGISNKTSRLYRALVDKQYAVGFSGGSSLTVDPFLYTISITLHPNRQPGEALEALDREIARVQERAVSQAEVRRAIKQARANFAYGTENITNQAFWLGYAEMFASYAWFESYLHKLAAVTVQDVRRVARQYLRSSSRVVGVYVPTESRAA
jgi:zinc protease